MLSDETARAGSRRGQAARRALGERRTRLQLNNRMENGICRSALSIVVKAAAGQQQKDQDRSGPSHLVH
jgi:hypothetical protein